MGRLPTSGIFKYKGFEVRIAQNIDDDFGDKRREYFLSSISKGGRFLRLDEMDLGEWQYATYKKSYAIKFAKDTVNQIIKENKIKLYKKVILKWH